MSRQQNTFIIVREDLLLDPLTVISEGLLVGRLQECELLLNHPSVSRTQAGIKQIEDDFYVFGLRPSNPIKLNGRPVERNEALASGDVIEVGPFYLDIDFRDDGALEIRVSLQIGRQVVREDLSSPSLGTQGLPDIKTILEAAAGGTPLKKRPAPRPAPLASNQTLDIFWDKRIREAGKIVQPSPLFPFAHRRAGKAKAFWTPTTDLARRHRLAPFFIWGVLTVGLLSAIAAYAYMNAYAPAPLSDAHARPALNSTPSIAARPNANSCTSCHTLTASMEKSCATCHTAEAFVATVIKPHEAAGIGCNDCHAEHRGADFRPAESAFLTCAECHNDDNAKLFDGKRVGTPHGGTLGYPVAEGKWKWEGLSDEDWALKRINVARVSGETDDSWRSKQFHAVHLTRVRADAAGLAGNAEGEMSCSSCHKTFAPIDRETPRQTCAKCHNGKRDELTGRTLIAADTPNCTSCHVQHVRDKRHWNPQLLTASAHGN